MRYHVVLAALLSITKGWPLSYEISSNGGAKAKYPEMMGIYKLTEDLNNMFPIYKHENGEYYLYVNDRPLNDWIVNDSGFGNAASLYANKPSYWTPPHGPPTVVWKYWNDGWQSDPTMRVSEEGCTIALSPLATWVRAPLDECLKACTDSIGCEAMSQTIYDAGNVCRFYGLRKDDCGPLYKCGNEYSHSTVYFKNINHLNNNQNYGINFGKILEVKGNTLKHNLQNLNIIAWANGNYFLLNSQKKEGRRMDDDDDDDEDEDRHRQKRRELKENIISIPTKTKDFHQETYRTYLRNFRERLLLDAIKGTSPEVETLRNKLLDGTLNNEDTENAAINQYTNTMNGRRINANMREKGQDMQGTHSEIIQKTEQLRNDVELSYILAYVIAHRGKTPDKPLFRHCYDYPGLREMKKGDLYTAPSVLSTTTSLDAITLDINEPPFECRVEFGKPKKALDLGPYSQHINHNEWVLGPNTQYNVVNVNLNEEAGLLVIALADL